MKNNEVIDSLKSARKEKLEALEAVQVAGVEAIKALDEARAANDEGKVADASAIVEKVGLDIKSAHEAIEAVTEQMGWFKEYQDDVALEANEETRKAEMKALFDELQANTKSGSPPKKTPGQYFADLLQSRGISRWQDVKDLHGETKLTIPLVKEAMLLDEVKGAKDIKSIYSNHGDVFVDASSANVPGFVGAQCGLVEDYTISCLLDPPAEDFEECLDTLSLNGNRIRFTQETARVNSAGSVLETIYNPYPNLEQDGTKPESSFTLATATVNDSTIASFITASDRVLEDCDYVAQHIDHVLISNVNQEKRRQLIAGSGSGGEMLGLLNQPSLLSRTHRDVGDGGAPDDNIYDTFRRGMTDLWFQNASTDNLCVIMNPRDGEVIDLTKDDLGRYLFNDSDCFNRQLRCLKIRYSTNVPQGTAIMGNFSGNWQFYLRKALNVRIGLTGNQFIENTQTILAEMRGLALVRCPRKIVKIDGLG